MGFLVLYMPLGPQLCCLFHLSLQNVEENGYHGLPGNEDMFDFRRSVFIGVASSAVLSRIQALVGCPRRFCGVSNSFVRRILDGTSVVTASLQTKAAVGLRQTTTTVVHQHRELLQP
ncbi:hypothetical protein L6164_022711 [Bauhinia variegata]|uniref:Uncharacterized protein n=1 Tax=Bauhinia variegata TaxID=167791 RepID=A0ACB9MJC8_BAUVA|nr:hypothetical protein L6164_022711 [Bauhinia variegata]